MVDAVEARGLFVDRGDQQVLKGLEFSVRRGEVFAMLGGNGAGKSTTLLSLLGFLRPRSGQALINGEAVYDDVQAVRRSVAYLPESVALYEHLSARENLEYFLELAEVSCSADEIDSALDRVALQPDLRDVRMARYSKGMRQKTAIALALLRDSPILFLDEPTSGLDPLAIDEFSKLVDGLAADGATILMVTHDLYGACQVADRVVLLQEGAIVGTFEAPEGGRIDIEAVRAAFAKGGMA